MNAGSIVRQKPGHLGPIVVGVDGSEESVAALRWGAEHAARVGCRIRAVTAFLAPPIKGGTALGYVEDFEVAEAMAANHAGRAIARAGIEGSIERLVAAGSAEDVISRHATDASMIVLGTRDNTGWQARLRASLTNRLSGRAPCPVVSVTLDHAEVDESSSNLDSSNNLDSSSNEESLVV